MFALDIETIPNLDMVKFLPEVKAKSTLKDPEKIKKDIAEKKAKQLESMGLNPMFCKIACIGYHGDKISRVDIGEEKEILKKCFEHLKNSFDAVVTYNGNSFDFDVIFKRGLYYDLCTLKELKLWTDKFKAVRHIDLMAEFCQFGKFEKLDTLAKVYLGEQKDDIDFKEIPELLKTKEGQDKLSKYCIQDCKLTYDLAKKFGY